MFSDTRNFRIFFDNYFEAVFRFARKYTSDNSIARDIAQDTFIRFYEKKKNFDSVETAKSFVYITARNLCLDFLKHQKIELQYNQAQINKENSYSFLHEITYQETLRILRRAIHELPPQSREIIILSLEGKNNNEIAQSMNISVNTVKTLKKGAYKKLKNTLGEDFNFILTLLFQKVMADS